MRAPARSAPCGARLRRIRPSPSPAVPVLNEKPPRARFRHRVLALREQAVISTVYRLLATKGYDAMTVDEVAAEVGIAKASLYKHFASKEQLAAAAMVAAIEDGLRFLEGLDGAAEVSAYQRLERVAEWLMRRKLAGEMPNLPARNSVLRQVLLADSAYMNALMNVSELLSGWIAQAQAEREIDPALPPLVVLYTLYARACDPVLEFLADSGLYSHAQIVALVMRTCFHGLRAAAGSGPSSAAPAPDA